METALYVWWHYIPLYVIIGIWLTVLEWRLKKLQREVEARDAVIGRLMVLADRFWKQ